MHPEYDISKIENKIEFFDNDFKNEGVNFFLKTESEFCVIYNRNQSSIAHENLRLFFCNRFRISLDTFIYIFIKNIQLQE